MSSKLGLEVPPAGGDDASDVCLLVLAEGEFDDEEALTESGCAGCDVSGVLPVSRAGAFPPNNRETPPSNCPKALPPVEFAVSPPGDGDEFAGEAGASVAPGGWFSTPESFGISRMVCPSPRGGTGNADESGGTSRGKAGAFAVGEG